ncbi:MAG TPA: TonB-dependent receptor [Chitinophagaceae bacterium]|jgi:outer membrane receptor protein involved in Fe transport|nr:TonB-dependent receptor [Chitinophagaceae bacterium]
MRKILTLLTVPIFLSITSFAQEKTAQSGKSSGQARVSGTVIDGNQKTIESSTITLLRSKDSSVAKISVADKNGKFEFEKVPQGKYLVSVSATGHQKGYSEAFEITEEKNAVVLKTIELIPQTKSLSAVTVTAKRPLVEQKIDRTIINVEASITNVGSSALEVLEKSPGISVDKDGNISLKGKEGVMILIDGRPTQLGGLDLANMLRSMNANQLDQIEIMTNPPAKYDAAGNAGIINIKTKKNRQLGYNGSANLGYGQGFYPRFNEGLNLNYRVNKVNVFTNVSHNYNTNYNVLTIQRNFRDINTKEVKSNFDQIARMKNENNSFNGKLGLDYFASKKTTFGFVLTGFSSDRSNINRNITDIFQTQGSTSSQTRAISEGKQDWKNFSTNLNFRQLLDTSGKELTADLDYITYDSKNHTSMINSYFDGLGNSTDKSDTLLGLLPQNIKIYSGRIDYLQPLKKGARFEAGLKSSYVKTDNDANYDSVQYGAIVHDFNRSNHFIYEENINAAYVNLNKPINKKWGAQVGLRLENTNAKGNQTTTGEKFDRHYTQLFPTAYLQYTKNKNNSFVLNYGRRIRRPDYQSLNPFINFLDRYTFQKGNPNLKPQFSHNIELSHTYKGFLTTTLNYSRTTDIIQNVIEQNEATNETFVKRANIAKQRQFGIAVNTSNPITKWWKNNLYVNVFNNKFEGIVNNEFVTIDATTLMLNGSQQFQFSKTFSGEISGFFRTQGIEGVIHAKPFGMMSVGLSKQIMKNNGTIRLNLRDVFKTQHFRGESKYSNVDAAFQERNDSRVINIGFTYRFSKGKINQRKRSNGSANDEQSRVGAN